MFLNELKIKYNIKVADLQAKRKISLLACLPLVLFFLFFSVFFFL